MIVTIRPRRPLVPTPILDAEARSEPSAEPSAEPVAARGRGEPPEAVPKLASRKAAAQRPDDCE